MENNAALEEFEHDIRQQSKPSQENEPITDGEHESRQINGDDDKEIVSATVPSESIEVSDTRATKAKAPIEENKNKPEKKEKSKVSLSKLFSCGTAKKTIKINLNDAIKSFNSYMTNFNGFTNAILCNSITAETYATLPGEFSVSKSDIQSILTLKHEVDEAFEVSGQGYIYTHEDSRNAIFGKMKSDSVIQIGIKYNKRLMLLATWSENIDKAKGVFLTCYLEIVKGNENI